MDLIFSPRFSRSMIGYLRSVIEDHLAMFVELYGKLDKVRLRPKHHFLVHLPTIILKSGPLTGMSCLRYELKNSFFKRSAHIVCNFTNICHTLAYRHQQSALLSLLSHASLRDKPVAVFDQRRTVASFAYRDKLCLKFSVTESDEVFTASKLSVASMQYKLGDFVLTGDYNEHGYPVCGKIVGFISCGNDEWYLAVEMVITVEFYAHFHAYCISYDKLSTYSILSLSDLLDHHPLYCHTGGFLEGVQQKYFRIPYHVCRP